jgi:uncharacterized damage-inducible protein DinB
MNHDIRLRDQLFSLLDGEGAHVTFDRAVADLPAEIRGMKTSALPYTIWELLEHMRIAQWDILEFSRDAGHASPDWPRGYWPDSDRPSSDSAWRSSIEAFLSNHQAMKNLVRDPSTDLFSPIPHGSGQTILREVLLVADHNSYHLGQIVLLRRLLGAWPSDSTG